MKLHRFVKSCIIERDRDWIGHWKYDYKEVQTQLKQHTCTLKESTQWEHGCNGSIDLR